MCKNIVIYYKDKSKEKVSNVDLKLFYNSITFDLPSDKNIDEYISSEIISELNKTEFGVIYIKDNLSSNYLELYGLRVAYHVRLTQELGNKIYLPIVILSDIDSHILNKLSPIARILFTKNIFIVKNTKEAINKFQDKLESKILTKDEYKTKFLNLIEIEAPKETHHDIANEWSIYKWSSFLNIEDPQKVQCNNEKINFMLYFKYLVARYDTAKNSEHKTWEVPYDLCEKKEVTILNKDVNILYIDDESINGWKDIFKAYFSVINKNDNINLKTIEGIEKISQYKELVELVKSYILQDKDKMPAPDIILLDLRLLKMDHDKKTPNEKISGIRLLKYIKEEINEGIQIILLTASGKSKIIEEARTHGIIGYIKKEHPQEMLSSTTESMDDLFCLVQEGYNHAYLKEIWSLSKAMIEIIDEDPFQKFVDTKNTYETHLKILRKEIEYIFDISQSDTKNKNKYAMVSIYTSFETIEKIFMKKIQDNYQFRDTDNTNVHHHKTLTKRIISIQTQKLNITDYKYIEKTLQLIAKKRNNYLHSNKEIEINSQNILDWFRILNLIIGYIKNPQKKIQRRASAIRHVEQSKVSS